MTYKNEQTITPQDFGGFIRRLRQEKGITLRGFAQKAGMSPTYLSKIERGDFKPPGEEKIRNIAKALGQDEDFILALTKRINETE